MSKPRPGARGRCKVRSGCQTCKIRHKKCDEARPSCLQCISTGRHCDFNPAKPFLGRDEPISNESFGRLQVGPGLMQSSLPRHSDNSTRVEANLFDFFRHVCAKEFALFFENAMWEALILRTAHTEQSIYHAALATSALTRALYYAEQPWSDPGSTSSANEYALMQYNLAIQSLNTCLDGSAQSIWLAILSSIIFINIEFLQGHATLTAMHLRGGLSLVRDFRLRSSDSGHFENALHYISNQVSVLAIMESQVAVA